MRVGAGTNQVDEAQLGQGACRASTIVAMDEQVDVATRGGEAAVGDAQHRPTDGGVSERRRQFCKSRVNGRFGDRRCGD